MDPIAKVDGDLCDQCHYINKWFNLFAAETQTKMNFQATFNCLNNALLVMYLINADIKQIKVLLTNSNVRFGFTTRVR